MPYAIYKVTNSITGQMYVGQTSKPMADRWSQHLWYANKGDDWPLSQATRDEALDYEAKLIRAYDTLYPRGYNLVAYGSDGTKESERTKSRRSGAAKLGYTEEHKELMQKGFRRWKKEVGDTPEWRAEMSRRRKGKGPKGLNNLTTNKLSIEDVREIKKLLASGLMKQIDIARKYKIVPSTITAIKQGRQWKDITL